MHGDRVSELLMVDCMWPLFASLHNRDNRINTADCKRKRITSRIRCDLQGTSLGSLSDNVCIQISKGLLLD